MKLNKQQLETITFGAVRICEDNRGFHFHRFTEEDAALFADRHLHPTDKGFDFYYKALAAELLRNISKNPDRE